MSKENEQGKHMTSRCGWAFFPGRICCVGGWLDSVWLVLITLSFCLDHAQSPSLQRAVGKFFGRLDLVLADFDHPAAHREFDWNVARAATVIRRVVQYTEPASKRDMLLQVAERFETVVQPVATQLRQSCIHGDGNEQNVLVDDAATKVAGLLDFGDFHYSWTVNEAAIVAAYVAMLAPDAPVEAAAHVVGGYHSVNPLTEAEWTALPTLVMARIAQSLALGAFTAFQYPSNADYLLLTQQTGWAVLRVLLKVGADALQQQLRQHCV